MVKLKFATFLLLLGLLLGTAGSTLFAQEEEDEPTAVTLASFDVIPQNNAVRIDWETGSELNTAAFRIQRGTTGGDFDYLDYVGDNGYIYGTGGVSVGAFYSVTDDRVQNGDVYTYVLFEVENSGAESEIARETVTVGIQPTATSIPLTGGGGGSNNSSTATPRPTSTATAVATSAPTRSQAATPTTQPTATRAAFATVTPNPGAETGSTSGSTSGTPPTATPMSSSAAQPTAASSSDPPQTTGGVDEVFAQEETAADAKTAVPTPETIAQTQTQQEDYPQAEPTAAEMIASPTPYPASGSSNAIATQVPVIGGSGGANPGADTGGSAGDGSNRLFLWAGFIVALLIFATGLIGSIILFIRKSN